ncbi:MAG TPA: ABC transporter permease [Ktedonobacteraceae bacterium]|nr:ABC transporter permease [Ktedonobacteraceae bacterium]
MAVPTVQRGRTEQRPPASRFLTWVRKIGPAIGQPVFAVILAIIAGGIVIMITSPGSLGDRFSSALGAYQALYSGSFGTLQSFAFTLVGVYPLILTGISVAIAYRVGLFNIGAEGQLAVGAMTACIIGLKAPGWPGWLLIPTMILGSMIAGAIWGGIVGVLKAWRGAHEVVTTIMLNWVAFYVTDYLINGPFKDPALANTTPPVPPQATLPQLAVLYNNTLGSFLPQIANPTSYLVDFGLILALLALVVYWFLMSRTTFGYEVRVIGQNPQAARYAGISVNRNIIVVMAIAGAFSGLAGAARLMGQFPYELIGSTFRLDTVGFDAIGVALLGHLTPIGVLFGALLFGGLRQGAGLMQLQAGIPGDLVFIIQALVLFSIASEFLPAIRRRLPKWSGLGRPATLTNVAASLPATELPIDGDNGSSSGENGGSTSSGPPESDSPGTDNANAAKEE